MEIHAKRNLDEEELPVKFRKLLILWGADDSYFSIEEIALILDNFPQYIKDQLDEIKRNFPQTYTFYAKKRQKVRKQNRFEDYTKELSNDWMDENFSWDENSKDTKNSTNTSDTYRKNTYPKTKHEEDEE